MKTYLPNLSTKQYFWLGKRKPKLTKEGKAILSTVKGREKHALKNAILHK